MSAIVRCRGGVGLLALLGATACGSDGGTTLTVMSGAGTGAGAPVAAGGAQPRAGAGGVAGTSGGRRPGAQ